MCDYHVYIGTSRRKTEVESYQDLMGLPKKIASDDGKIVITDKKSCPMDVACGDCGTTVRWAEANFVPMHRICPKCGSHWELSTIEDGEWILRRARFYRRG